MGEILNRFRAEYDREDEGEEEDDLLGE